jgi:TorA maturation chaperone TorD
VSALSPAEAAGPVDAAIDLALARGVLYGAVALGLRPPAADARGSLVSPAGHSAMRAAAALVDARLQPAEALRPVVDRVCARAASGDRAGAHARLFGHSRGLVCPFETEYGADGAFRQPQELADIAGTYRAFGLGAREGGDERVDHAACECEFMGFLARREAFALDTSRTGVAQEDALEGLATVEAAARGFLREHLGRFGRAFASLLMKEDADGFHGSLGAVLFRFLTAECRRFALAPGPPSLELRAPLADDTPMACGRPDGDLIQVQRRPRP